MSDLRELEPEVRTIDCTVRGHDVYEFIITAWPYSGMKSERVMSRNIVYRVNAAEFNEALAFAKVALNTVAAMHDIWKAKIVSVSEAAA